MATATDSFAVDNASGLNANWTEPLVGASGSSIFKIVSGAATPAFLSIDAATYWNANTFGNDQYSEVAITANTGGTNSGGQGGGPATRVSTSANTHYRMTVSAAASNNVEVASIIGGSYGLVGRVTSAFSLNDVARMEISGSAITLKKNGVSIGTMTDSSIATGQCGMAFSSTMTAFSLDNWGGGDLSTAVPSLSSIGFHQRGPMGFGPNRRFVSQTLGYSSLSGDMAGSASLTIASGSSTLAGAGALSASGAITIASGSSTIRGVGALAAASTITLSGGTATIAGAGALSSAGAITLGASGTLSGAGAISASGAITVTCSGTLGGSGALSSSGTITLSGSGTIRGAGAMSAAGAIILAASGSIYDANSTGALVGTATFTLSASLTQLYGLTIHAIKYPTHTALAASETGTILAKSETQTVLAASETSTILDPQI